MPSVFCKKGNYSDSTRITRNLQGGMEMKIYSKKFIVKSFAASAKPPYVTSELFFFKSDKFHMIDSIGVGLSFCQLILMLQVNERHGVE